MIKCHKSKTESFETKNPQKLLERVRIVKLLSDVIPFSLPIFPSPHCFSLSASLTTWSSPDPGVNQRQYSEDEDDIVNFARFAHFTQLESEGELDRCSSIDEQAIESSLSPSLRDLRSGSPHRLSFNTSLQNQSIHRHRPSKSNRKCAKRTLELISDDQSVNVERIKK